MHVVPHPPPSAPLGEGDERRSAWPLGALERLLIGLWFAYTLVTLVLWDDLIDPWPTLIINLSIFLGLIAIRAVTHRQRQVIVDFGRACSGLLTCAASYEVVRMIIDALPQRSYELEMLKLDALIFGGNPSVWMESIYNPLFTEYFQLVYVGYFPILFLVGISLFATHQHEAFNDYAFSFMLAVIVTHILYVLVPVRSPFVVASAAPYNDWIHYSKDLVGIYFADGMRASLLEATTMRYDCFPSGHTMHSLIAVFFAYKGRFKPVAWIVTILTISIIISTLYLRYHYGIDLIIGALGAAFFCYIGPPLRRRLDRQETEPTPHATPRRQEAHPAGNRALEA